MKIDVYEAMENVAFKHDEYHMNFYGLLYRAIEAADRIMHKDSSRSGHIDTADLYLSVCSLLLSRYGPLAPNVLKHWGVNNAADIGIALGYLAEEGAVRLRGNENIGDFSSFIPLQEMLCSTTETPRKPK